MAFVLRFNAVYCVCGQPLLYVKNTHDAVDSGEQIGMCGACHKAYKFRTFDHVPAEDVPWLDAMTQK